MPVSNFFLTKVFVVEAESRELIRFVKSIKLIINKDFNLIDVDHSTQWAEANLAFISLLKLYTSQKILQKKSTPIFY